MTREQLEQKGNMNILELIDYLMEQGLTEAEAELWASETFGIYETEDD